MQKFKIKSLEEVKMLQDKTLNEIKRDFKIQIVITAILVILALIICFKAWDTAVKYEVLKKDNEKEIYEGDIVQGLFADQEEPEIKGQVIYSNGQASYIVIASNNDEWELGYLDNLEVIGNIYDNLKLLGGEDESTR